MGILEIVVSVVAVVATPLVLLLARKAVQYLERKTGLDLSTDEEMRLTDLVRDAIGYAEQSAKTALKSGGKLTSSEKLSLAESFISREMSHRDLAKLNVGRAKDLIESRLGKLISEGR